MKAYYVVMCVLSLLNVHPGFVLVRLAEEFMEQLKPIFEALRQREELPCSYPLHVGSTHGTKQAFIYGHSRSQGSTTPGAHHYTHHHGYQPSPGYHWVMLIGYIKVWRLMHSFISGFCSLCKSLNVVLPSSPLVSD